MLIIKYLIFCHVLKSSVFIFISLLFAFSCTEAEKTPTIKEGFWRMQMNLGEAKLPFNFEIKKDDSGYQINIHNAKEVIEVTDINQKGDSLFIQLPVYETEFLLSIDSPQKLSGVWRNYYRSADYEIKVIANYGLNYRFFDKLDSYNNLASKYEVYFNPNEKTSYPAMGLFQQSKELVRGTFVTETGDYRHLEGQVKKDSLFLSSFDGAVAYLFKAAFNNDSIQGEFWSGNHHHAYWKGIKNDSFKLRNPDDLTHLKEGYDEVKFSLPNSEGKIISLSNSAYTNKAVIVQIMGSWCHNCLDETKLLSDLYEQYKNDGLQIVALAFERTKSKAQAFKNIDNLKNNTNANYPFLLAAWNKKTQAQEKLPMLNHIISYPTTIFINRKGEVVKIHTGFYGPSSGELYKKYVHETTALIEKLLGE